jgi:hypothetical protein
MGEKYCLFAIDVLYSHLNKVDRTFNLKQDDEDKNWYCYIFA